MLVRYVSPQFINQYWREKSGFGGINILTTLMIVNCVATISAVKADCHTAYVKLTCLFSVIRDWSIIRGGWGGLVHFNFDLHIFKWPSPSCCIKILGPIIFYIN
jgi:hypothetical protein